jgi:hypothetical protein
MQQRPSVVVVLGVDVGLELRHDLKCPYFAANAAAFIHPSSSLA